MKQKNWGEKTYFYFVKTDFLRLNWARVAWHRTEIWGSISKRQQKNKKAAAFYIQTQQLKEHIKRPSLGSQMPFESNFPSFLFVADDDKISQDFFLGLNLQMIKKKEGKKERNEIPSLSLKFSIAL